MNTCPSCGASNEPNSKFCNNCGKTLSPNIEQLSQIPAPPPPNLTNQPVYPYDPIQQKPLKDRSIAMVLEILPGLFGFLGFGWIYSGNSSVGVIWLIGFFVWTLVGVIISVVTGGIGAICIIPISIFCIVFSAVSLSGYTNKHPEIFRV
jgi:hypothetical protein